MTTKIEIDQEVAEALTVRAQASGLSLNAYLRRLAEAAVALPGSGNISLADFDRYLDELAADLPQLMPLPSDFSRRDVYAEND